MTTTLLVGGQVYTPTEPFATAILVAGDTVAWVGTDGAADVHRSAADRIVELNGALVTPAFVDAHVHTTSTGLTLLGLDLTATRSLAEALALVEQHCRQARGGVVLGHGWDETRWPEHRPPTAAELDRASYGGVVYLSRIDVHACVVSSALLAAVPEARLAPGYDASGWLRQDAHHLVRTAAYEAVTPGQREEAIRATRARAASLGIGSFHENGGPGINGPDDFQAVLAQAVREPGPQVFGYWGELGGVDRARELGARGVAGDLFVDGAIGSRTALMHTVYADADSVGASYLSQSDITDHVVACSRAGVQAGFHVIGDAAMTAVVNGLRVAAHRVGPDGVRAGRHRLEHAEMLTSDQIAVLADLGVVASVQPLFDELWGGDHGMYAERLGVQRALTLNPLAQMAAAGVVLALGSDAPVTPLGPWAAIRAAAWHHVPESRLSVRAAFNAHTRGGWRAAGIDDAGVLAPGAAATFAVWSVEDMTVQTPDSRVAAWSTDPRAGVPELPALSPETPLPECLGTVVGGVTVFEQQGALS